MMRTVCILLIALCMMGSTCYTYASEDYPPARWVPAYSGNYTTSNRPSTYPIWYVIVHVVQGSYNGCISWFQNPSSRVSAHYVIRSSDGEVTQMVRHKDIAWHAGNWWYNCRSIGIEHEGWVDDPKWFTYAMYYSSAALVRHICRTYGIPRTRSYILGHVEVPNATHTDPGPNWDWDFYMQMVQSSAILEEASVPLTLRPGEVAAARLSFRNTGDITWQPTGANPVRLGTQNPRDRFSPFYTPRTWISPNRPTSVSAVTPPEAYGYFDFTLTAPERYGTYEESYQLVREGVTWFGPIVTFRIDVVPWDIVLDNVSENFSVWGTWNTGTTAPGKYGADYRWTSTSLNSTAYARWYLNVPLDGYYDVYAWWSQGSNRSTAAQYEIVHRAGKTVKVVNQQTNGGKWNWLGRYQFIRGTGFVYLRPKAPSGYVAIADAVRIVGPMNPLRR